MKYLLALDFTAIGGHGWSLRRGRGSPDGELHEPLHSDVLLCRKAEHRHDLPGPQPLSDTCPDLVLGKYSRVKELLHEGVIVFRSPFDKGGPEFLGLILILGRNLQILPCAVFVLEMIVFHLEDIDETVESRPWIDRILDDDRLVAECLKPFPRQAG